MSKKPKIPVFIAAVVAGIVAVGAVVGYRLWEHYKTAKEENKQLAIAAKDAENVKKITDPFISFWPIGVAIFALANRRQCGNFVKQCIKNCNPNSAGTQNSGAVTSGANLFNLYRTIYNPPSAANSGGGSRSVYVLEQYRPGRSL